MQKYQSKKDDNIIASEIATDEKCKTTTLVYLSGEKAGKSFVVTDATLKRWWRKIKDSEPVQEETEEPEEEEVFHVKVEDASGNTVSVDMNPNDVIPGVDDKVIDPNEFNPPESKKKVWVMPKAVKEYARDFYCDYRLPDGTSFPDMEDLVDMLVSWGADVKSYKWCVRLTNRSLIILRPHKQNYLRSCIEVRMTDEVAPSVTGAEEKPMKGAMYFQLNWFKKVGTLVELEELIREMYNTQKGE